MQCFKPISLTVLSFVYVVCSTKSSILGNFGGYNENRTKNKSRKNKFNHRKETNGKVRIIINPVFISKSKCF